MQQKLPKRDEVLLLSSTDEVRSKTQAESKYLEDIVSLMKKLPQKLTIHLKMPKGKILNFAYPIAAIVLAILWKKSALLIQM
jgi:hypothetical protein